MFGLLSVSEARPGEEQAKSAASTARSQRSIHDALTESSPARAEALLDRGANIEARNTEGATPLITASGRGNIALVTLLLKQGAQVQAADRNGNTALHEASFYGHPSCVEALLTAGAQTSIRNALAFTPLHQAVRRFWETSGESRADRLARQRLVVDLLLSHGADPGLSDDSGRTPLVLATESNNGPLSQAFNTPPPVSTPAALATTMTRPSPEPAQQVAEAPLVSTHTEVNTAVTEPLTPEENRSPLFADVSPNLSDGPHQEAASTVTPEKPSGIHAPSDSTGAQATSNRPEMIAAVSTPSPGPEPTLSPKFPMAETQPPAAPPEELASQPQQIPLPTPSQKDHSAGEVAETALTPAVTSKPLEQPPAHDSPSSTAPLHPEQVDLTNPQPAAGAIASAPQVAPASMAPSPPPSDRSEIVPLNESSREADLRQLAQIPPSAESEAAQPSRPLPAGEPPSSPSPATPPLPARPPVDRPSLPTQPAPVSAQMDRPPTETNPRPWLFQNFGFGLGFGWTHNLGARRVDSVTVVNGIVRIDNERNDLVRFMPEIHVWIDRWDEQRWSWGPFLTVAPGARIVDAVGFGLMMGYRPHRTITTVSTSALAAPSIWTLASWATDSSPTSLCRSGETTARTKQTTAAGLLVLFSVGWDLAAPHHVPQTDR